MKNYGVDRPKPKQGTNERMLLDLLERGASFMRPFIDLTQEQIAQALDNLRAGTYDPEEKEE